MKYLTVQGCARVIIVFHTFKPAREMVKMNYFAVIDTETNWDNDVMSIGVVIADRHTFEKVDDLYFILDPEYKVGGMFSSKLRAKGRSRRDTLSSRGNAVDVINRVLAKYDIKEVYAYNASFDKNHMVELEEYEWFDIMRIAAYKQYNDKIPASAECCKTGRMKRDFGVEPMLQLLSGNCRYMEAHNALYDAIDELEIMRLLGRRIDDYSVARI